jgi:hypothetical protein
MLSKRRLGSENVINELTTQPASQEVVCGMRLRAGLRAVLV